jgi:hypothetical protein
LLRFRGGQAKQEVCRKPSAIPLHGLIEGLGRDAVKVGQVRIEQDFLAAQGNHGLFNPLG